MKKEGKRTLISTIFEGYAVKQAITKLSPDKLILLIDEPFTKEKKEKMDKVLGIIKEFSKKNFILEKEKISSYDIPKIMKEVIRIIDKESKEENEIFIHITEGRKITALALLFAAYIKKEKIEGVYYITEEEHKLISLPMLDFQINETKKDLLKEISKGNINLNKLMTKLEIKKSTIYQNIKELKNEGYITENIELTELGRIMFL